MPHLTHLHLISNPHLYLIVCGWPFELWNLDWETEWDGDSLVWGPERKPPQLAQDVDECALGLHQRCVRPDVDSSPLGEVGPTREVWGPRSISEEWLGIR
jgi:hypothetical protein